MDMDILKNYQNFKIYFTFFLIWISIQFGDLVEDYIGYVLVISIGILHGANDLLILSIRQKVKILDKKNLITYLGIVFICFLLFYIQPFFSICLFILISSYHFGEEHFSRNISVNWWFDTFFYTTYGLLLFAILFTFALDNVKEIMVELTGNYFNNNEVTITLITSVVLFLLLNVFLIIKKKINLSNFLKELFYLALIAVVFNTSSLILGFAIYFILWHSIPSILGQIEFISGDFNKKNILFYLKKGAIFWGFSILGLLLLYVIFIDVKILNSLIFMILFAVTAPHIWVMNKMKN